MDVLAVDRRWRSVATHSMLLRVMQPKKGAEKETSIEVVGTTKNNNDSYRTGLTDHIIDGDCAEISIPRPHKKPQEERPFRQ